MKILETDKLELCDVANKPGSPNVANVQTLEELFADKNPLALDLLKKMLVVAPEQRITVVEALEHPFFEEFHDPEDEPEAERLHPYDFDFELYDLTAD